MDKKIIRAPDGSPYLTRWTLAKLGPLGSIRLHKIHRPDADQDQHDHPWPFVTLVLSGGYIEEVGGDKSLYSRRPGYVGYRPACWPHRIVSLLGREALTLVWIGPSTMRRWGFYTPRGWVFWRAYLFGETDGSPCLEGKNDAE